MEVQAAGRTSVKVPDTWYVGVDSQMHIHMQQINRGGWIVKTEQIPPDDIAREIYLIVGHVEENEIKTLLGEQKLAVMRLLLAS